MKIEQKAYAVIFKHEEGWTISGVEFTKIGIEQELQRQKKMCPGFEYRIVPIKMAFSTLKN